jgi:putative ABC transport system permease protein
METLLRDIRLAVKLLWKDRGFATTAIATLAVCIGANTAIFTIVNSVLLRPLPVPESRNILIMGNQYPNAGSLNSQNSGVPDYYDRLKAVPAFEQQALYNSQGGTIEINGTPERVSTMAVTPSLFRLLRVAPALGRTFVDAEGEQGNESRVVLSYGLWLQLYAGDSGVLGREIRINGSPYTIVGVMPKGFLFVDPAVRLWTPLAFTAEQKSDDSRHSNSWFNVGRLRPGATLEQAQAQVDALNATNLDRFPPLKELLINAGFHTRVSRLQDVLVQQISGTLYLLWVGAAFVLLIGGVNIANLVLARAALRRKEVSTRLALGATRGRIMAYLMVESLILALAGGLGGLLTGAVTLRLLASLGLDRIPRAAEIQMDATVFLFAIGVATAVGLLIGLVPALDVFKVNVVGALQEEGRSGTGGRQRQMVRRAMVVAQVAFACLLLIGAGLLLMSFRQLLAINPGFKADGVITASLVAPQNRYAGDSEVRSFMTRVVDSVRSLPGVTGAGTTTVIPLGGNHSDSVIIAEGYVMKPGESVISPMRVRVAPGYFEAIGATLKRGRFFNRSDIETAPREIIVDERLARKFWPDADPIGRRMFHPNNPKDLLKVDEHTKWLTVVGVVGDIHMDDITGNTTVGAIYLPMAQDVQRFATLAVKTTLDTSTLLKQVRAEIAQIDPEIALFDIRTMAELTDSSLTSRRTAMTLAVAFAAVALFLSALGIYGVLAYMVEQRSREIGIRIALGSTAGGIFKLVLAEGTILIIGGLALGLCGAVGLHKALESQLYGIHSTNPWIISAAMAGLAVVALSACALPAHRATRLDPIRVLTD